MGNIEASVILDGLLELLEKQRLSSNDLHETLQARVRPKKGQNVRQWDMTPSQVAAMQTVVEEKDRWIRHLEELIRSGRAPSWRDTRMD